MAALDAVLEKSFEESAAPGVVGAVQTPEYTWGVRALGVADRTSQEQMTLEVHHRIGSTTKTFAGYPAPPSRRRGATLTRRYDRPLRCWYPQRG